MTAFYYQQTLMGLPVWRRWATVVVRNVPGTPVTLVSGSMGRIDERGLMQPVLSRDGASNIAGRFAEPEECSLWVYAGVEQPLVAYRVVVDNNDLAERVRMAVWINAVTGDVITTESLLYEDAHGTVSGYATPGPLPNSATNLPVLTALPGARVTKASGAYTFSAADGTFVLASSGWSWPTLTASVGAGKWADVRAIAGSSTSQSLSHATNTTFDFALSDVAQVNAFLWANRTHEFAKSILPSYPGIDVSLPITTDIPGSCNAYYDGRSLNFMSAGGNCPNTAYSTIIAHEYGHHIITSGHPWAARDYHEGMADATSNLLTSDPRVGMDFHGPGSGALRDSQITTEMYPSTAEMHLAGGVIAGSLWNTSRELRSLEIARRLYLNSILLRPPGVSPQLVIDMLILDDDDGDLWNGTPHSPEILAGFGSHNLLASAFPAVRFHVDIPADVSFPGVSHIVPISIQPAARTPDLQTALLWLSDDGENWESARVESNLKFPPRESGTILRWYVSVRTTDGLVCTYPPGGRYDPAFTVIGYGSRLIFEDDFETHKGWAVTNVGLSVGGWERVAPIGTIAATGELAAPAGDDPIDTGSMCFVTGNGAPGGDALHADVDGGPTILTSPAFDLSGGDGWITFRSWFFCNDGSDLLTCQVSNDDGATWVTARKITTANCVQEGNRLWTSFGLAVSEAVSPSEKTRIRFLVQDAPNNSITEAGIDSVTVTKYSLHPPLVPFTVRVDPGSYNGRLEDVGVDVELRSSSGVFRANEKLTSEGSLYLLAPEGIHDLAVKGDHWLRVVSKGVVVTSAASVSVALPTNGDVDGNNAVDLLDMNSVFGDYGQVAPESDLDGSSTVDLADVVICLLNFGMVGPP